MGGSQSTRRNGQPVPLELPSPSGGAVVNIRPRDSEQQAKFDKYASRPGCFVPMVLPTPELVEELHRVLAKHNCSGITSIGSGGRLDFERQLARHPSNPRIKAIDMLEPTIVVDEDVVYTQTLNCWEAPAVGKEDVMLFCWGTKAPWQEYVERFQGAAVLVFSGVDSRVESHPNPVYPEDAAFFANLGFKPTRATVWKGAAFWLGECKMTEYTRNVLRES